ncbi:MBL fold metallo-hydrolase [Campylobacter devanensis]|uniref:MBL fold metallo-hydrolase n=1 Tax=Campylobacter devanensis TaxID=3161138 RepID=UPI000A333CCF|nr:MBL fold metallo-hydrolase [Campylobacter sp. P031]
MQIISRAFGIYGTNCYVVVLSDGEIIIDPGDGALEWIERVCKNPLAVFCTHGHFDHVYDCDAIKAKFGVDIYIPKDDAFLCQNDPFGLLQAKFNPDILVSDGEEFDFSGVKFAFCHFPGHTPGCSVITAGDVMFSGDFIFKNSIGRYDFPFSDGKLMRQSLKRAVELKNYKIYPGHGEPTSLDAEINSLIRWAQAI